MIFWFSLNGLVLSKEKTNIAKFTLSYCQNEPLKIMYQNQVTPGTNDVKFLGLELRIIFTTVCVK
jgi:hypothetical protein